MRYSRASFGANQASPTPAANFIDMSGFAETKYGATRNEDINGAVTETKRQRLVYHFKRWWIAYTVGSAIFLVIALPFL